MTAQPMNPCPRGCLATLLTLLLLAAGCGIALDDSPQPIGDLPIDLTDNAPPTPVPAADALLFQIYMIGDDNRLSTVAREITLTPEGVMNSLLLGTDPAERERGITSAINERETSYSSIDAFPESGRLRVNLTDGSLQSNVGGERKLALVQMVYSLAALPGYNEVAFTLGGTPLAVPADAGDTAPGEFVSPIDFLSLVRSAPRSFGTEDEFDTPPVATPTPTVPAATSPLDDLGERVIVRIWLIGPDDHLIDTTRSVVSSPEGVLASLILGPDEGEKDIGYRSEVSSGANAIIPDVDDGARLAFVNLSPEVVQGTSDYELRLAVAQVVFTLTEVDGIDSVQFTFDGEDRQFLTDNGVAGPGVPVTRDDFVDLLPAIDDAAETTTPTPTPTPTPAEAAPTTDQDDGDAGTAPSDASSADAPSDAATPTVVPTPTPTPEP
ncbi:MAG: GerMN domain-containing protein [Actinomycetota bacterium]